jgi:hypothetical protein
MHIDGDASMSMEGDLSRCSFDELNDIRNEPDGPLQKNTLWVSSGRHDFVVIPLNEANRKKVIRSILPRIGVRNYVWHFEIAKNDIKIFGSYDRFYPECVWLDRNIGEGILPAMQNERIVPGYELKEASV